MYLNAANMGVGASLVNSVGRFELSGSGLTIPDFYKDENGKLLRQGSEAGYRMCSIQPERERWEEGNEDAHALGH